jgi:hypothetical protein
MFTQEVCPTRVVHAVNACPEAPTHDEKHNARDAVKRKHPDEEIDLGVPTPEYPCGVIHREQGYESEYVWDAFQDVLNIAEREAMDPVRRRVQDLF